jgi:hypothetical protein
VRHALVIARRELGEKRFVAFAAAAFAVLPFLLAMIPLIRGRAAAGDVIATGAGLLAIGFTAGLALVLGGSVIGRDLSENRLSFYFARPVGAASIWFGKAAAGLALITAAFLIIVLPARLGASGGWQNTWGKNAVSLTLLVIGGSFVLYFVAHVVGSFIRSRSALVGLDFAAFCLAAFGAYLLLRPLFEAGATRAFIATLVLISLGVTVALVAGGAWQLERGRTDRRRSHLALSQFVWIAIAAGLLVAAALVAWLTMAPPSALTKFEAAGQERGPWVVVGGPTKHRLDYPAAFVYNTETGAYTRLASEREGRFLFTRDGASLLVAHFDRRTNTIEFFKRALDRRDEVSTGLTASVYGHIAATDDGSRLALADRGMLTVYDVPEQRSMMSARLPQDAGFVSGMYFVTPTLVRVYAVTQTQPERTLRIYDLDAGARTFRQTGSFKATTKYLGIIANADGSRLIARGNDALYLLDGRTAAVQATTPAGAVRGIDFLRNGGIAVARANGGRLTIELRDAAGAVTRSFDLPAQNNWGLRELSDGRLLTIARGKGEAWSTLLIDSSSGAIVQKIPAAPVGWREEIGWLGREPRRRTLDLPKLFTDEKRLIRWNYAANQAEVVLPRG